MRIWQCDRASCRGHITDPQQVYETAGKLFMTFIMEGQGKIFLPVMQGGISNDMYLQTPQLRIEILRDQAASYGISPTRIEMLDSRIAVALFVAVLVAVEARAGGRPLRRALALGAVALALTLAVAALKLVLH